MKWLWLALVIAPAAWADNTPQDCLVHCATCPVSLSICQQQNLNPSPEVQACVQQCLSYNSNVLRPDNVVQQVTGGAVVATGAGTNCQMVCGSGGFDPVTGAPGPQKCHPVCSNTQDTSVNGVDNVRQAMAANCQTVCTNSPTGQHCYQHCATPQNSGAGVDKWNWTSPKGGREILVNDRIAKDANTEAAAQANAGGSTVLMENTKQIQEQTAGAEMVRRDISSAILNAPPPPQRTYAPNDNWVEGPEATVEPDF